jgi:hypothetical protein
MAENLFMSRQCALAAETAGRCAGSARIRISTIYLRIDKSLVKNGFAAIEGIVSAFWFRSVE